MGSPAVCITLLAVASCGGAGAPRPALSEISNTGVTEDPAFEPATLYEMLFDDGATLWFDMILIGDEDDMYYPMRCRVTDVSRSAARITSQLVCDGASQTDDHESNTELEVEAPLTPGGFYTATGDGLYRSDSASTRGSLVITAAPVAEQRGALAIQSGDRGSWCAIEYRGEGAMGDDYLSMCFRAGAGLVFGKFWETRANAVIRGRYELRAISPAETASPIRAASRLLVINEVSTVGDDWFEIVNTSDAAVQLDDFVYTDRPDDFSRAVSFPTYTLEPGGHYVQRVARDVNGFQLASEESLAIYRRQNQALSDLVEWPAGASPEGGSYARVPDTSGAFKTVASATPGQPN